MKSAFLSEINWSRFAVPWRSDQALPSFLPAWPGKTQCNTALCFVGAFHFRNAFKFAGTLSGSCNAAQLAAEEYQAEHPSAQVFVLDSLSAGPELVLLAEHLRALIKEGREFDDVCEEMLRYRHHTHLLFSLESLANLARNGRIKPTVAAVARMLNIRVIGKASDVGELDVLCKTRGEHGALERIVLELKGHGYTSGKVIIAHCGNPAAAERLMHMVRAVFEGAQVRVTECGGLCSYYAELGGLMVGFEDADA